MSAKAISEAKGKELLNKFLNGSVKNKFAIVKEDTDLESLTSQHSWLESEVCAEFISKKLLNVLKNFSIKIIK